MEEKRNYTKRKLTHSQFYQLCESLKEHKATIESRNFGKTACAKYMETILGFPISPRSIPDALAMLGESGPKLKEAPNMDNASRDTLVNNVYRTQRALRYVVEQLSDLLPNLKEEVSGILSGRSPADTQGEE